MREYQLYLNGGYRPARSGKIVDNINPATGEVFARVHQADVSDAKDALDTAWDAFQDWKSVGPSAREAIFLKAAQIMEARADELKDVLIDEAGSIMFKAVYETTHTPIFLRSMAGECRRITGET